MSRASPPTRVGWRPPRAAGIRAATFIAYVDHNLGHLLKDAFVVPEPLDAVIVRLTENSTEQGARATFTGLGLPDARARIESAIAAYDLDDHGAPASETWPHLRALLLHCVRGLPEGGAGYDSLGPRSPGEMFVQGCRSGSRARVGQALRNLE